MSIGEKIKKLLVENGMTQKDLARRIGLDESVVSRFIKDERKPKPETIANIATALKTTSDYLLDIENDDSDFPKIKRLIARGANKLTNQEKKDLINALLGDN